MMTVSKDSLAASSASIVARPVAIVSEWYRRLSNEYSKNNYDVHIDLSNLVFWTACAAAMAAGCGLLSARWARKRDAKHTQALDQRRRKHTTATPVSSEEESDGSSSVRKVLAVDEKEYTTSYRRFSRDGGYKLCLFCFCTRLTVVFRRIR
jgi:hypothetical protein